MVNFPRQLGGTQVVYETLFSLLCLCRRFRSRLWFDFEHCLDWASCSGIPHSITTRAHSALVHGSVPCSLIDIPTCWKRVTRGHGKAWARGGGGGGEHMPARGARRGPRKAVAGARRSRCRRGPLAPRIVSRVRVPTVRPAPPASTRRTEPQSATRQTKPASSGPSAPSQPGPPARGCLGWRLPRQGLEGRGAGRAPAAVTDTPRSIKHSLIKCGSAATPNNDYTKRHCA